MFVESEHPEAGRVTVVGRPIKFPHRAPFTVEPAPEVGRDSEAVLTSLLGLSEGDLADLRSAGVVQ